MNTILDQVILVDQNDQPIGTMDKVEAHRGEGVLHRAISVYLFDEIGRVLIQQRSASKIVGAGQWANTCCGNVRPGESYQECAARRLREELGIGHVEIEDIYTFTYAVKCNAEFSEREIDHVFVGRYVGQITANPSEVAQWEWVEFEDLIRQVSDGQVKDWAPWLTHMIQDQKLVTLLKDIHASRT